MISIIVSTPNLEPTFLINATAVTGNRWRDANFPVLIRTIPNWFTSESPTFAWNPVLSFLQPRLSTLGLDTICYVSETSSAEISVQRSSPCDPSSGCFLYSRSVRPGVHKKLKNTSTAL
jgi:hypothetical protein